MSLNAEKRDSTLFSNDPKEAKWGPVITLDGRDMSFKPSDKFLGVHLDDTLSFTRHVKVKAEGVQSRYRIRSALGLAILTAWS